MDIKIGSGTGHRPFPGHSVKPDSRKGESAQGRSPYRLQLVTIIITRMADNDRPDTRAGFDAAAVDFTALGRHPWHPTDDVTVAEVCARYLAGLREDGIAELDATTLIGTGSAGASHL
jgi:hypothetical protein